MSEKIKWIICLISGFIVDILGGWDMWLTALLTVMVIDILTGILKAVLMRSNKSESGGLSSESMFRGGAKKVFIFLMVALGAVLDSIISPDNVFINERLAAAGYFNILNYYESLTYVVEPTCIGRYARWRERSPL